MKIHSKSYRPFHHENSQRSKPYSSIQLCSQLLEPAPFFVCEGCLYNLFKSLLYYLGLLVFKLVGLGLLTPAWGGVNPVTDIG